MKISAHESSMLDNKNKLNNPPPSQYDVGINCDTDYTHLLTLKKVMKVKYSQRMRVNLYTSEQIEQYQVIL